MILLRLSVRSHRGFLLAWVCLVLALVGGTKSAYQSTFPTPEQRLQAVEAARRSPASVLLYGDLVEPGTPAQMFGWEMGAFLTVLVAVMAVLLAVSVTRSAEDDGTWEVLRATGVPAGAGLGAAAALVSATAVVLGLGTALALVLGPGPVEGLTGPGAAAFGAVVGSTFLLHGFLTLAAAQVVSTAPAARTLGAAAVGVAFVLRAVADTQDAPWLNWLTPLGLRATVRPFSQDRWWAVALAVAAAAILLRVATGLFRAREYRAGLLPARPAPSRRMVVRSVAGLAVRLEQRAVLTWSAGVGCAGAALCALGAGTVELAERGAVDGGLLGSQLTTDVQTAYLRYTATVVGIVVAVFAVLVVLAARGDETTGRTDLVRTTGARRWSPLAGRLVAAAGGCFAVLLVTAVSTAATAAAVLGPDAVVRAFGFTLGQWIPSAAVAGFAVLVVGVAPRLGALAWLPLSASAVLALLGELLGAPDWLRSAGVFEHVPDPTAPGPDALPVAVLLAAALTVASVGLVAAGRRDVRPG